MITFTANAIRLEVYNYFIRKWAEKNLENNSHDEPDMKQRIYKTPIKMKTWSRGVLLWELIVVFCELKEHFKTHYSFKVVEFVSLNL